MSLIDKIASSLGFERASGDPSYSPFLGRVPPERGLTDQLKAYHGWVYACVSAIADEIAAMELFLDRRSGKEWTEVGDHAVLELLGHANPFMSRHDLLEASSAYEDLGGEFFWYMVRTGEGGRFSPPQEIWPLRPDLMTVVPDKKRFVAGYVYRNPDDGSTVAFDPAEIIHHKRFNPTNPNRGLSTVAAAAIAIDTDQYAAEHNRDFFFNAAQPGAVLETDQELSEVQFKRLKRQWEERYGGRGKAHKTAILEKGLTYKQMSLSPKDAEFIEQRKLSRDEILGIFRVPKSVLGITEDVNRANAEATDYIFATRVIRPRMARMVATLNEFLLPMFGLSPSEHRLRFKDPTPENRELEVKLRKEATGIPYRTVNESRTAEGLEPVDGGDDIYVPATVVPLAQAQAMTATDDPKPDTKAIRKGEGPGKAPSKTVRVLVSSPRAISPHSKTSSETKEKTSLAA